MAKREPKGVFQFGVQVEGRDGKRVARFEVNSGGIHYFRKHADSGVPTHSLTLRQLTQLLDSDAAMKAIDPRKLKLPKAHPEGDLQLEAGDPQRSAGEIYCKDSDSFIFHQGRYSFDSSGARNRRRSDFEWTVTLSTQGALRVIDQHIAVLMSKSRRGSSTNKDVVVSKDETRLILQSWLRRLDSPVAEEVLNG